MVLMALTWAPISFFLSSSDKLLRPLFHVQCGAHSNTKLSSGMFVLFMKSEWMIKGLKTLMTLTTIKHYGNIMPIMLKTCIYM